MVKRFMMLKTVLLAVAMLSVYVYLSERRRWRSKGWLIALFLRMLAIVLLWLLLSPIELTVKHWRSYNPAIHILVDTSLSMRLSGADDEAMSVLKTMTRKLGKIVEPSDIHIWAFGEFLREVNLDELNSLKFADEQTRLVANMLTFAQRIGNSDEPIVIVLTDGQDADSDRLSTAISAIGNLSIGGNWAIVGVGKGEAQSVSVEVTPRFILTFPKSTVSVRCSVRLASGESYSGELTVSLDGRRIHQSRLALTRHDARKTFELTLSPPPGEHVITASCTPGEHEQLTEDNRAMAFIRTVERNVRALFIAGSPNPEFKFIKRALESDGAIELLSLSERDGAGFLAQGDLVSGEQVLRLSIDRATLNKFDIVIVGNIDASSLPPRVIDELAWYVGERGGTLLILGGDRSLLNSRDRTLMQLLPVEPSKGNFLTAGFSLTPTGIGLKCPAINMGFGEETSKRLWKGLPKLKCGVVLGRPKGASQILLRYDGAAVSNDAALVWHRYGAGKVMVFAPFDTWRWWMDAARRSAQPTEFLKFWQGIVRCMPSPLVDNWVTLTPDKTLTDVKETLTVRAVWHSGPASGQPSEIKVEATHEDGSQATFNLDRHGSVYIGRVRLDKAGTWTLKPLGMNGNRASVVTAMQLSERMRVGRNEIALRTLSEKLNCKLLTPDEALKFAAERVAKKLKQAEVSARRLNTLPWLYLAVLALLSFEWLIRRWRGLT